MQTRHHLRLAFALLAALAFGGQHARAAQQAGITIPAGFTAEKIAQISGARELSVAPNGDLFVGTEGNTIYVVPNAEGTPGEPKQFASFNDRPVAGVFVDGDWIYAGAQFGVYRIPYRRGDRTASARPEQIAKVRTSLVSRDHQTTTVAVTKGKLYASVGSSCNACDPELDATRATVQEMNLDGTGMHTRATDIRNAIALAVQSGNGDLWVGIAGRDDLQTHGHPYEIFDDMSAHSDTPDYGWLKCDNDRTPINGANCSNVVLPEVVLPGYDTPIGATFYPTDGRGRYTFPPAYRGGAFVTLHGSWHVPLVPPRVAFVPFRNGAPAKPVDWRDPNTQWTNFVSGCQNPDGTRTCRPTGIAVGPDGSLFVSEDDNGTIWRIRPTSP